MERIAMSQQERDELDWLKRAKEGRVSQREAAERIGVSERWVRTLLKRMGWRGDGVVVHGLRGRPSNRKLPSETQRQALKILKQPDSQRVQEVHVWRPRRSGFGELVQWDTSEHAWLEGRGRCGTWCE